jgi:hypothetical protein
VTSDGEQLPRGRGLTTFGRCLVAETFLRKLGDSRARALAT